MLCQTEAVHKVNLTCAVRHILSFTNFNKHAVRHFKMTTFFFDESLHEQQFTLYMTWSCLISGLEPVYGKLSF